MKIFCCKNQWSYGSGLILVAANTKEEAYLTAAYDNETSHLFDWFDDNGVYSYEPDRNINHCASNTYPFEKWYEVEHLSTDLSKPQIIVEDHYSE